MIKRRFSFGIALSILFVFHVQAEEMVNAPVYVDSGRVGKEILDDIISKGVKPEPKFSSSEETRLWSLEYLEFEKLRDKCGEEIFGKDYVSINFPDQNLRALAYEKAQRLQSIKTSENENFQKCIEDSRYQAIEKFGLNWREKFYQGKTNEANKIAKLVIDDYMKLNNVNVLIEAQMVDSYSMFGIRNIDVTKDVVGFYKNSFGE